MKKGVIFDMDGVLFDTERLYQETWNAMAVEYGLPFKKDFGPSMCSLSGQKLHDMVHRFYPQADSERLLQMTIDRVKSIVAQGAPEKVGVHEILVYLKENGYKIAVASSSERSVIEQNLNNANMMSYFDFVASGFEVEHGKPAPDIFLFAAQKLGLEPEECYVCEDSANGIRASYAAGCDTLMVVDLTMPTEELRAMAKVYDSMTDVLEALKAGKL